LHEREDRLRGMRAGANDFLLKPADLPYVLLRVRNAIRLRQLHAEVEKKLQEISREQQMRGKLMHMIVTTCARRWRTGGLFYSPPNVRRRETGERPGVILSGIACRHNSAHQIDLLLDIHRWRRQDAGIYRGARLAQVMDKDVGSVAATLWQSPSPGGNRADPLLAMGEWQPPKPRRVQSRRKCDRLHAPTQGEIAIRVLAKMAGCGWSRGHGPGIEPSNRRRFSRNSFRSESMCALGQAGWAGVLQTGHERANGRIGVSSRLGPARAFGSSCRRPE